MHHKNIKSQIREQLKSKYPNFKAVADTAIDIIKFDKYF